MTIESPSTYGEWYWAQGFDAQKAFDESIEQAVSPSVAGMLSDIPDISELPVGIQNFLHVLAEPHSAGLGGLISLTGAEFGAELLKEALAPAMAMLGRAVNRRSRETWLTAEQAVTLSQRKKISDDYFYLLTASEGYEDIAADSLYTSLQPYPTIPDIMRWSRYHGDVDNIKQTVWEKFNVAEDDFAIWEWLTWEKLNTLQCQTLLKREVMSEPEFYNEIGKIGWHSVDRDTIRELAYILPNPMLLVQGDLQQESDNASILRDISKADIHPDYAQQYLDAVLTKPASQDIVAYQLRQDPELSGLEPALRKIGIHPAYAPIYKELAYQIPPVADIITMAVREAFSPEIAARFGQYQDFPPDFELWAGKKGLSKEWAERYWAAHWNLPSPQQGFEMLHRGVIDQPELDILLRALDVMPYWRDRLTRIAYRPLTRVDVRRMYKQGVLDEGEVYESYLEQGYDDKNAKRMAEFTVRQTLASLSKFTSSDIIRAFASRMISKSDAMSLLQTIGIRTEDANYIVSTAEYKRQWAFTDSQIAGIKNLYKKRVYDDDETQRKLTSLGLPSEQITVLMQQWFYEVKVEPTATWTTAQTLSFLKAGFINRDRAERELYLNGYDKEHVDIYLRSIS